MRAGLLRGHRIAGLDRGGCVGSRQEDFHSRARPQSALQSRGATELGGEPIDLGQAETAPFANVLGGEEGLEGVLQHLGRHTGPVVRHADHDVFAAHQLRRERRLPRGHVRRGDADRAALRHGIPRVDREVQQHELELGRVAAGGPEVGGQRHLDLDQPAQAALQQLRHAADHQIGVHRLGR